MENNSREYPNALKFGEKIYFEDMSGGESSSKPMASPVLPAAAPSGKRGKGAGQPPVPRPRCQVEGCNLDLTGAKSYYCRHKVCGMHSKSPKVIVAGLDQRFCQQCSRFHLLTEFDQGKRSCRRRLAGHNERRRKPPLEPLPPCYGRMPSFHEDSSGYRSFLMDFTHPRPPDVARDIWPTIRSSDRAATNQWQGRNFHTSGGVMSNTRAGCIADVSDSTCALSLLSTQPWGAAGASATPTNQQTEFGTALPNIASSYMDSSWAFKDHAAWSSSNEMGLRQIKDAGDGQFLGELELALEENRHCPEGVGASEVYDHHLDMHWSL